MEEEIFLGRSISFRLSSFYPSDSATSINLESIPGRAICSLVVSAVEMTYGMHGDQVLLKVLNIGLPYLRSVRTSGRKSKEHQEFLL